MPKFGTKNAYLGIFAIKFLKTIVIFEISIFEFVQLQNFVKKQKCLNLGPKTSNLGIFDQKCYISVFLSNNFKNTIVIFEIIILKFTYLQKFTKKQKYLNLGPKMPYFGIFDQNCLIWVYFRNNLKNPIVIFEISTKKQKYLNLGPKMPYLGIFGLEF